MDAFFQAIYNTQMQLVLCFLWAMLAGFVLRYLTNLSHSSSSERRPPGPRPLPVVGNLLDLRGNLHQTLACLARSFGPVMSLRLGHTTAVVVSTRDAAREAFTSHGRRLAARAVPDAIRALKWSEQSMIWLPSSHPQWQLQRGILATHVFSPRSLAASRGMRERKVRDLVSYIRGHAGQVIDVGHAVHSGVLNLVSSTFFSSDVVDMGVESAQGLLLEHMVNLIELLMKPNISDIFPCLRHLDLQGCRRYAARHQENVLRILEDVIDRRLRLANSSPSEEKVNDFLDRLLHLMSTGSIARDNVTNLMFDVFLAGTDAIAITVVWAMAELLRNPSIMAKVRVEINAAVGSKKNIEETDTVSLPYLQAVVKEAMRLHPGAPLMLPRQAVEDGIKIHGYTVPKGSTVIFNVWAIMREAAVWERPNEFLPERFLDKAAEVEFRDKDFKFLAFGYGRKQCPGLPMAELVVPYILASLLHEFEWRLPNGISAEQLDVSEKFTTANVLSVPLKAVPIVMN